jgi:broad specificity phosphatase PhoE
MGAIYLIRHGQASFGAANYDQLSKDGMTQSRVLGEALKQRVPKVDAVARGSMQRHRQTADACLAAMGVELPQQELPGFNEYDHEQMVERYEPRYADKRQLAADIAKSPEPRRAFQEIFIKAMERWASGRHDGEYTESWAGFGVRCVSALDQLIATAGPSKTVLVFTSGGPITAICQNLLQVPDSPAQRMNWTLANCGVTKVIYSERSRYLSTLNEHAHFEGALSKLITYR